MKKKLLTILGVVVTLLSSGCGLFSNAGDGHTWANEWESNETEHWHACIDKNCKETNEKAAHVYDKKVVKESLLKDAATCTTKAIYYMSCVCGAKGTETFEYGKALGHKAATTYSSDSTWHWKACTHDGCEERLDEGSHTGGNATVGEQAICETCKKGYGGILDENGGSWSPWQTLK